MRTTLTLDDEVAARVKTDMRRTGRSLKAVVNDALRRGLGIGGRVPKTPRFVVRPRALGLRPGMDADRLNQLVDELETDAAVRKLRS
jgi:hypothetical protein